MTTAISARQRALLRVWNSERPDDLLVIMTEEPAAREAGIALELQHEAEFCESAGPELTGRLRQMATAVEEIHATIDRFANLENMAGLLACYQEFPLCWARPFNRLLGAFWVDALHGGEASRIQRLRRALGLLSRVYFTLSLLRRFPQMGADLKIETIRNHPLLCDQYFHRFLDERGRLGAKHGSASAETFREIAGYIRENCQRVRAITKLQAAQPSGANIEIRLPLPLEMAELWFVVSPEFAAAMAGIAAEVASSRQTLEEGVRNALEAGHRIAGEAGPNDTFGKAAFLEYLLRVAADATVPEAIANYRGLIGSAGWKAAQPESRATWVLRYSKALLAAWRRLDEAGQGLRDALALIDESLPEVDVTVSPRLMRDLLFTRARLRENLGIWDPAAYEAAAEDYRRGLAVPGLGHETEPRGGALTDLANTLHRLSTSGNPGQGRKIRALYEEALGDLPADKYPLTRGISLTCYAIYLNESREGDRGADQEAALANVQQAIDLLERALGQGDLEETAYVRAAWASAYLAKATVLNQRQYVRDEECAEAARHALRTALARLGDVKNDQLHGVILLNLGHVNMDLYAITGSVAHARDALYAYGEAERLLQPYPHDLTQALLGGAMIAADVEEARTSDGIATSLETAQKAVHLLEATTDEAALGRGLSCVGTLLLLRDGTGDSDNAIEAFGKAAAAFRHAGHHVGAIAAARRAADARVRQYLDGHDIVRVGEARDLLIEASGWVDDLWERFDSVEWRHTVSERFSDLYAEIAWCQATLGRPVRELISTIARAKGREFVAHIGEVRQAAHAGENVGTYLDQLRIEARLAEMSRWRAQRQARPDESVVDAVQAAQGTIDEISIRRRLLLPRPVGDDGPTAREAVEAFLVSHPNALAWDISVSRWGTVVALFGGADTGNLAGMRVQVLPLQATTLHDFVVDPDTGWAPAYAQYLSAAPPARARAREEWAGRTGQLLEQLGRQLIEPVFGELPDSARNLALVIAPGRLGGLPLHAAPLRDGRCLAETIGSVVYVPNVSVLPQTKRSWTRPDSALCILSDPSVDPSAQLPTAPAETAAVAAELRRQGAAVTCLAVVGSDIGRDAFEKRGMQIADGITVLDAAPTPGRIAARLPGYDHVFYSGHGIITERGQSGLCLIDDDHQPALFAEEQILTIPALIRRPLVVLSACDTAHGGRGTSPEMFDFASSLLRIGAGFVVGSLWAVSEDCARQFSGRFYEALGEQSDPSAAFGLAVRALKKEREQMTTAAGAPVQRSHPIYWAPFVAILGT